MKRTIKPPVKRIIDTNAITHGGETLTIKEWSKRSGVPAFKIYSRLALGWSEADAITGPKGDVSNSTTRTTPESKLITHNGETLTIAAWSERTGISYGVLDNRFRNGWTPERALTEPVNGSAQTITHNGETLTFPEWSARTGIRINTIRDRLRADWTPEQALTAPVQARAPSAQKPAPVQPGVVSDFAGHQGTGGGRTAQDRANISFSPKEQVKP